MYVFKDKDGNGDVKNMFWCLLDAAIQNGRQGARYNMSKCPTYGDFVPICLLNCNNGVEIYVVEGK